MIKILNLYKFYFVLFTFLVFNSSGGLSNPNADELRCKSNDFTTIIGEPLKCKLLIGNEDEKAPEKITISYGDKTTETFDKFEEKHHQIFNSWGIEVPEKLDVQNTKRTKLKTHFLSNTEFMFDSEISGFEIYAIGSGKIQIYSIKFDICQSIQPCLPLLSSLKVKIAVDNFEKKLLTVADLNSGYNFIPFPDQDRTIIEKGSFIVISSYTSSHFPTQGYSIALQETKFTSDYEVGFYNSKNSYDYGIQYSRSESIDNYKLFFLTPILPNENVFYRFYFNVLLKTPIILERIYLNITKKYTSAGSYQIAIAKNNNSMENLIPKITVLNKPVNNWSAMKKDTNVLLNSLSPKNSSVFTHLRFQNLKFSNLNNTLHKNPLIFNATEIYLNFNQLENFDNLGENLFSNLTKLSIAYNHLTSFEMEFVSNIKSLNTLDLSNNRIENLSPYYDKIKSIEILDLNNNRFQFIDNYQLHGLIGLEKLNLSNNLIHKLSLNAFKKLNNLKELDLSRNLLSSFLDISFSSKGNLKFLDLSSNSFTYLKPYFLSKLKSLKTLKLARNSLKILKKYTFYGLGNLEYLDLSENELYSLESNSFYNLLSLKYLFLNSNKIKSLYKPEIFSSIVASLEILNLNNNLIDQLTAFENFQSLSELHLEKNKLENFSINLRSSKLKVFNLRGNSLKILNMNILFNDSIKECKLYLDNNSIEAINIYPKSNDSIRYLHLSNNQLIDIQFLLLIKELEYLDLSFNKIQEFDLSKLNLDNLTEFSLSYLNLSNNIISDLKRLNLNHSYFKNLIELDLSSNMLESIESIELKKLTTLVLSNNKIKQIGSNAFINLLSLVKLDLGVNYLSSINFLVNSIEILNLSFNRIEFIEPGSLKILSNLVFLNLNRNKLEFIESDTFKGLSNLVELSIESSLVENIASDSFNHLSSLEILNLNDNKITSLEISSTSLKKLILSKNKIESIESCSFINMLNLTSLDLSFNNIQHISTHDLRFINLVELFLNNNENLATFNIDSIENLPKLKLVDMFGTTFDFINDGDIWKKIRNINFKSNKLSHEDFVREIKLERHNFDFIIILT